MNCRNLKEGKLIIRNNKTKKELEIISEVGDYGYIVCRETIMKSINDRGNLDTTSKIEYNVLLKNGEFATEYWFDDYDFDDFGLCIIAVERSVKECQDLMKVKEYTSEDGKNLHPEYQYRYGVINQNGENTIRPIYDRLDYGTENTVIAYHNGLLGFVDTITGDQITPIIFPHVSYFSEGLAEVEWMGLSGYVERSRTMTSPRNPWEYAIVPKYTKAGDFENGVAEVEYNGENRYINRDGIFLTKETARLLRKNN